MQVEEAKIGQRVRYVGAITDIVGLIGTCVYIDTNRWMAIAFDSPLEVLHACEGHCKDNYGWWCKAEDLELISVPLNVPGVADYAGDMGECIRGLDVLGLKRREISSLFGDILHGYFHEKALQETIKRLEGGSKGV